MAFATTAQLAAVLPGITSPGSRDTDLQRVLDDACLEIISEIGWVPADDTPDADLPLNLTLDEVLALCNDINVERAADIWHTKNVPSGLLLAGDTPLLAPRSSWDRYANRLAPLKKQWGFA